MHLHSSSIQIGTHGRVPLGEFQFNAFHGGEGAEETLHNTSADVLQQSGGDIHLSLKGIVHIGVTHGVRHVVSLSCTSNVHLQPQIHYKFITYCELLSSYAMIGKEADVVEKYITVHIHIKNDVINDKNKNYLPPNKENHYICVDYKTHKIMKLLCSFLLSALFCLSVSAQNEMNGDSLAADFRCLVQQLEATHPDPYSGFGGKVFFHKQAYLLENELRSCPHTLQQFWDKSMAFLSSIQDGHTYLFSPSHTDRAEQRYLTLGLRCIPDGLILNALPALQKALLGSILMGINGKPIDELLAGTAVLYACENLYNRYAIFSRYVADEHFLKQLLPDLKDTVSLNLRTPQGEEVTLELPLRKEDEMKKEEKAKLPSWDGFPGGQMDYRFIDPQRKVMMFKTTSIMARDNFEYMYDNMPGDLYRQLEFYYQYHSNKEMPADTLQAIRALPSFSGTFARMLKEMKKNGSESLIIDLRDNGGGWTPIVLATIYQLYGDRYLQTVMGMEFYRIISPLYMNKLETTLEEFNKRHGTDYAFGDYDFDEEGAEETDVPVDTLRRQFVDGCMSSVKDELRAQQGAAVYTPKKVYVVTNERTFSAAFHYAFMLWKMGATLVGVPSGQAPNTFMEQTLFTLPYTRLEGSISNSAQIFLPGKDRRAKTLWPDVMMKYEDYKKYGFDGQAEIRYLLENLEH